MRSQKQNNRSPRPFKNKGNDRGWAGGNRKDAPLPFSKFTLKAKKPEEASKEVPPAEPPTPSASPPEES
ncbi:MAG: hypothetical protein ACAH88_06525 [Roseimicrobium sp.]